MAPCTPAHDKEKSGACRALMRRHTRISGTGRGAREVPRKRGACDLGEFSKK